MIGTVTEQLAYTAALILGHAAATHGGLCSCCTVHDHRWTHAEVHPADLPWIERRIGVPAA